MIRLDTEEGIERAAEQLMKDAGVSKLDALNIHLGKYKSQGRLEEGRASSSNYTKETRQSRKKLRT